MSATIVPHCPPPSCPLPPIPVSAQSKATRVVIQDLEEMIREIQDFKINYFDDGWKYSKNSHHNKYDMCTSDVLCHFEDMMNTQVCNWNGYDEFQNNISKFPFNPTKTEVYALCTRNLWRYRQCCEDKIDSLLKRIQRLEQ